MANTSQPPICKRVDKEYYVPPKGAVFHPIPDSLVINAVNERNKQHHSRSMPHDKVHQWLDLLWCYQVLIHCLRATSHFATWILHCITILPPNFNLMGTVFPISNIHGNKLHWTDKCRKSLYQPLPFTSAPSPISHPLQGLLLQRSHRFIDFMARRNHHDHLV